MCKNNKKYIYIIHAYNIIMFIVNRRQTVLIDSFRRSRPHDNNIYIIYIPR